MWRSGGIRTEPAPSRSPAPGFRWRGLWPLVAGIAVFFGTLVFLFPILFKPGVEPPTDLRFLSPSTLTVHISNLNVTPLEDVKYSCEVSQLKLANGSSPRDANALTQGAIRKIPGRRGVAARCQTGYLVDAPLQALEYKMTVTYRAYPWPRIRTSVYRITAQINAKGEVTGWKIT